MLSERSKEIDLDNVKLFIKDILKKNMFKNIFKKMYNDAEFIIITQNSFINNFVDNHLFLVPFTSENYSSTTNRFSCDTYIFCDDDKIFNQSNKFPKDITNVTKALKISRFILLTFYEFSHYIYSYILHSNNYIYLTEDSPIKKDFTIKDEGYILELILFGKIIEKISLEQALYILDLINYEKNEIQFQKDFIDISEKKLNITGYYEKFNEITKEKNFDKLRTICIKVIKKCGEEKTRKKYHCVLGRGFSNTKNTNNEDNDEI